MGGARSPSRGSLRLEVRPSWRGASADTGVPRFFLSFLEAVTMKLAVSARVPDPAPNDTPLGSDSWGGETDWSLIRRATSGSPEDERNRVWGTLIRRYEGPVRRVLARQLRGDPGVEEAAHDFFSELFQKRHILDRADPDQGRFRCYIQGVIRRYALQWKRANGTPIGSDIENVELAGEAQSELEREEELVWADAILHHALVRLESHSKRDADFLRRFYGLFGTPRESGEDLAEKYQLSPTALHVGLHRARTKLKSALIDELRPMVSTHEDMQEEVRFLISRLCSAHPGLDLAE